MICPTRGSGVDLIPVLHVIKARDGSVKAVDAITKTHRSRVRVRAIPAERREIWLLRTLRHKFAHFFRQFN